MFKSKNVNDKRCAYKSKFFNKKIEKDLMIFDIEIDFERQIKALPHYTNSQNLIQSNLAIRNSLIMNKLVKFVYSEKATLDLRNLHSTFD